MKGFEQAFELLAGFEFEDAQSRENALWLWVFLTRALLAGEAIERFPLVVITGPSGSGKSTFVKRMFRGFKHGEIHYIDEFNRVNLDCAARSNVAAILCEDRRRFGKRSKHLAGFLSSGTWMPARLSVSDKTQRGGVPLRCVCIATGINLELPKDLERRAIFIRLNGLCTG